MSEKAKLICGGMNDEQLADYIAGYVDNLKGALRKRRVKEAAVTVIEYLRSQAAQS